MRSVCGDIPIVICGNKCDLPEIEKKIKSQHIENLVKKLDANTYYVDMSNKVMYNTELPILWLARKLLNNDSLRFVEEPAMKPPGIAYQFLCTEDTLIAASTHLPDEYDDSNIHWMCRMEHVSIQYCEPLVVLIGQNNITVHIAKHVLDAIFCDKRMHVELESILFPSLKKQDL